jgi:hypothetical protein
MMQKIIAVVMMITLNSCVVGYRHYPREQLAKPAAPKQFHTLYYFVEGQTIAGGHLAIRGALKKQGPFEQAEERAVAPESGVFVHAKIQSIAPSVGAFIAGYVSYATLTILPSWSTRDGAMVVFTVYKDGQAVKTYEYETRRFIGVWLGLLPFIWANLLTANEEQVCVAITKQFFEDAEALLKS